MHNWGDKNVDWDGINEAATYIHDFCIKRARLGGDYKEKYGTVRFYAKFHYRLHDLVWPGHPWLRYKQAYWYIWSLKPFVWLIGPLFEWTDFQIYCHKSFDWCREKIRRYQAKVYRKAYKNAIAKWPHLREEILTCADYSELLEGL